MRLDRLGCAHPNRLSFLRQLLRRVAAERWRFDRPAWAIDATGVGHAVYRLCTPERSYSLVAFSHDLPDHLRSDRVIATAWDATFALYDGNPTPADIERLAANVPLQEAGRVSARELSLSRANRSERLFEAVIAALAAGEQPTANLLDSVGYLMRTTAVYGSGKFGAADRSRIAARNELAAPFQVEMLAVWLIRTFTIDLVEHLARERGGAAATVLDPVLRRRLGVGNSTGLGMAPFLIRHPLLLNNWILARERALQAVRSLPAADPESVAGFIDALAAARDNAARWQSGHPRQIRQLEDLRADLDRIDAALPDWRWDAAQPWNRWWRWGEASLSIEGQEALLALLLEPHGALIDHLGDGMRADEDAVSLIDGAMPVSHLQSLLHTRYRWALPIDYSQPDACARFWYVSEEKLEPRLGERHREPGAERELPLDIGRQARALHDAIAAVAPGLRTAELLWQHPELRGIVHRVQLAERCPYSEIHDNLIDAELVPLDILRCKLANFGATRFDPRSDRWVRISLFQHAPTPNELCQPCASRTAKSAR